MKNKNQFHFIFSIFFFITTILFLAACGSNKEEEIIGKWNNDNDNLVEFQDDGVVTGLTKNVKKVPVDGFYKIKDDSLLIEFTVTTEPKEIKGSLDFLILKLDADSLILDTDLGSLNYWRTL
ncbi:MAG: hypothetical protein KJN64_03645 [Ignavibacteria bacterium]|nr:hypothetical protein [Ignavibacteria bacterium]MBT8380763.1 hypothetical protein [Ignavibacteria bacterium]MBT8390280.1 hypothetical protein [Ignavibacteria bacterium]NNJ53212.1 hypothetical protein [Ignavibacteriaceae bacterium]NNL22321.1 hypothetical protein [Ignavibacteriaceae bacterium]